MRLEIVVPVVACIWAAVLLFAISRCRAAKRGDDAMRALLASSQAAGGDDETRRSSSPSPAALALGGADPFGAPSPSAAPERPLRTLDLEQAARLLDVSPETLLTWEQRFGFPSSYSGGAPLQPIRGARPPRQPRQRGIHRLGSRDGARADQAPARARARRSVRPPPRRRARLVSWHRARSRLFATGHGWQSGRPDLNRGPRRPERRAIPGCATPRRIPVSHRQALFRGRVGDATPALRARRRRFTLLRANPIQVPRSWHPQAPAVVDWPM